MDRPYIDTTIDQLEQLVADTRTIASSSPRSRKSSASGQPPELAAFTARRPLYWTGSCQSVQSAGSAKGRKAS